MIKGIDLNVFYADLDAMYKKGGRSEIKAYMEDYLQRARVLNDVGAIVAIANELGGLCRAMAETTRARELYDEALYLLEKMGLSHTEHYATTLINAGDVYVNMRQLENAKNYFDKAKKLLEELGLGSDYRMAALCNNLSLVYRDTNRLDEAEAVLNTAFSIIRTMPSKRAELATTYVNLGEVQVRQNKLEMAKENFLSAISIFESLGVFAGHYPDACAGLGQVYWLKNDRENAVKYYTKTLELIKEHYGKTEYYDLIARNLEIVRGN